MDKTKYPLAIEAFLVLFANATQQQYEELEAQLLEGLDRSERAFGGDGLKIVERSVEGLKYNFVIDPIKKEPQQECIDRMNKLATLLKNLSRKMSAYRN